MASKDKIISLNDIIAPISNHLMEVERLAVEKLDDRVPLLSDIGEYTFGAGGKRIRPALLLFSAGMHGKIDETVCLAATVIEYIHSASLLHDDVVDDADLRRGKRTVRKIWGNEAAVLAGDYLFMLAFRLLHQIEGAETLNSVLSTATAMTEGELMQLNNKVKVVEEADILAVIEKKTSSLIGSAMEIGAILNGAGKETQELMRKCGEYIGTAFQLIDDALDYDIENHVFGKAAGKDFLEKKITFPLFHLLKQAKPKDKTVVEDFFNSKSLEPENLNVVYSLMTKYGSIDYTAEKAKAYCDMAIDLLHSYDDSAYKNGIVNLTKFIISRSV